MSAVKPEDFDDWQPDLKPAEGSGAWAGKPGTLVPAGPDIPGIDDDGEALSFAEGDTEAAQRIAEEN